MEITNKALSLLLIGALIVSVGGTFLSLQMLDSVSYTGHASLDTGTVQLSIADALSITTQDGNLINFGTCQITPGVPVNITSERTKNTSTACSSYSQTNISVRNNGNVGANVTINASAVGAVRGGLFLNSTSEVSDLAYKISNSGRGIYGGGCVGEMGPGAYTPFLIANEEYLACDNLQYDQVTNLNSFVTNFEIVLPGDVDSGLATVTITYTASQVLP